MPNTDSILKDADTDGIKTHDYVRYVVAEDNPCRVDDEDGFFVCQCQDECIAREVAELRDFYYQNVNAYEHHLEVIQELVSELDGITSWLASIRHTMGSELMCASNDKIKSARHTLKLAKEQ